MAANALSASTGAGSPSTPATEKNPVPAAARPRIFKTSLRLVLPLPLPPLRLRLWLLAAVVVVGAVRGSRGGRPSARILVVVMPARGDGVVGAHRDAPVVGEAGITNSVIHDQHAILVKLKFSGYG